MEYTQEDYTRHYIVQALFLLMNEYTYEKISITDVVKKAGVGRATFYRYFKSKEDVLLYYFETNAKNFIFNQRYFPRCKEDHIKIATDALDKFRKNKECITVIHKAHLDYLYLDFLNKSFLQTFKDEYNENNPYAPYLYAGMLYNVSFEWLKNDCEEPPEELAKMIVDAIYFNG